MIIRAHTNNVMDRSCDPVYFNSRQVIVLHFTIAPRAYMYIQNIDSRRSCKANRSVVSMTEKSIMFVFM